MPTTRTMTLVATGVLAIVAAGFVGATLGSQGPARSDNPSLVAASTPSGADTTTATAAATPREKRHSPAPTKTSGSTSAPSNASELLPTPASEPSPTGYRLPAMPTIKQAGLLRARLPAPAVAKGRLVSGFPPALAPPARIKVESSSLSVAGYVVQAAFIAKGGVPEAIMLHYRQVLRARGFAEQDTSGVENAPAAAFTKGKDNVTVTTRDGKTYLLANLRPDGSAD